MLNRNRTPSETYRPMTKLVAQRILDSSLAAFCGHPGIGVSERMEGLRRMAAEGTDRCDWSMMSIEFRRAGTNVSIDVRVDAADDWSHRDENLDADGNGYRRVKIEASVNWPCHGSCDPGTALARLELYREAALLAADINASFGGESQSTWHMIETKADRDARKAKEAKEALDRLVALAVNSVCRGMRAGGKLSAVESNLVKDIPDGDHLRDDNGKQYLLSVRHATDDTGTVHIGFCHRLV